jgi:methylated-DNA-[protein]-cysteine S-methyltransferase
MTRFCHEIKSPVGRLKLVADDSALVAVVLRCDEPDGATPAAGTACEDHPVLVAAARQLAEYFAGRRTTFDLPLRPAGTEFQQRVWRSLREIPFGRCWSYSELAEAIGQPTATRAVGAACGKNPLGIVVPCHRVIGCSGRLTGFAGGLEMKAALLELERRTAIG